MRMRQNGIGSCGLGPGYKILDQSPKSDEMRYAEFVDHSRRAAQKGLRTRLLNVPDGPSLTPRRFSWEAPK